jgi:hypothetical protein
MDDGGLDELPFAPTAQRTFALQLPAPVVAVLDLHPAAFARQRDAGSWAGEPGNHEVPRPLIADVVYGRKVVPNELSTHVLAPGGSKSAASANRLAWATDCVTVFPLEPP